MCVSTLLRLLYLVMWNEALLLVKQDHTVFHFCYTAPAVDIAVGCDPSNKVHFANQM